MAKIYLSSTVLIILLGFFLITINPLFAASNLELSKSADFPQTTTEYLSEELIYARIRSDSTGDKMRALNLRDNRYNLISSYQFTRVGDLFVTSLKVPREEGYYSLEARIESEGKSTTSVKTIKVGKPKDAHISVNVGDNLGGESVSSNQEVIGSRDKSDEFFESPLLSPAPSGFETESGDFNEKSNFLTNIFDFFKKLFSFVF